MLNPAKEREHLLSVQSAMYRLYKPRKIICLQAEGSRASSGWGWRVGIPVGGAILPVCHASAAGTSLLGGDLPCHQASSALRCPQTET